MFHEANETEFEITSKLDFIVPLKQVGLITRAVVEAIHAFYAPRRIIIISSKAEGKIVRALSPYWDVGVIEFVDEETFFELNYNLSIKQILSEYDAKREGDQREPGWWIQQLIKLGAASQIPGISTHYIVWDGDLVPTRRWKLAHRDRSGAVRYYIAVLQAEARSEFNSYQYAMCMKALTGDTPRDPQGGGTFVAHHMVFNKYHVREMLAHMCKFTGSALPWPLLIMSYSRKFYRFSEYKTYATYMLNRYPAEFLYHPLSHYGEGGLRFRDANRIVEQMLASCPLHKGGLSYTQIRTFAEQNMSEFQQGRVSTAQTTVLDGRQEQVCTVPGYIQLDHVYGIAMLGLDPEALPVFTHTSQQELASTSLCSATLGTTATTSSATFCCSAMELEDPPTRTSFTTISETGAPQTVFIALDLVTPPATLPAPGLAHANSSLTASAEFKGTRLRTNMGTKSAKKKTAGLNSGKEPPTSPSSQVAAEKASPVPLMSIISHNSHPYRPRAISSGSTSVHETVVGKDLDETTLQSLYPHPSLQQDQLLAVAPLSTPAMMAVMAAPTAPAAQAPQSGWFQFPTNSRRMQQS